MKIFRYPFTALMAGSMLFIISSELLSQDKPAYAIHNHQGLPSSWKTLLDSIENADVVLFGEYHNNPIVHWLQYELTDTLIKMGRPLILGAEMYESDNQEALNMYLAGEIDQMGLDSMARLWKNHKTDYKPVLDLARDHQIPLIATNIPRIYASRVSKGGFEALHDLTDEEKAWLAPLPIDYDPELPGYAKMLTMMGDHATPDFPKAQAIKDATMAYFISKNYMDGQLFLHFHGTYHSDHYEGILWYLKRIKPELRYITISTVQQKDPSILTDENKGKAHFTICVHENMTTTY